MHSSHQSPGRILFDFSCALVIVASCVGAWMQTGASALLGAAAAAGLHGLVHLFDMKRPKSAEVVEPQRIGFAAEPQGELVATLDAAEPPVPAAQQRSGDLVEEAEMADQAPRQSGSGKTKPPRKAGGRRVVASKAAKATEVAPSEDAEVVEFALPEQVDVAEIAVQDDMAPAHIEPLFEPEPFARMPRRAFGRRGQI